MCCKMAQAEMILGAAMFSLRFVNNIFWLFYWYDMLMFTQTSLRFAPDVPIENNPSIM